MTDGTTASGQAPGWGIDWWSHSVRRRYFGIAVAFALGIAFCVIAGRVIVESMIADQKIAALGAAVFSVGAFIGLATALLKWLRPLTADINQVRLEMTASKADLLWSTSWISIIFIVPAAISIPAFFYLELKPFGSLFISLFLILSSVVFGLYPLVVNAIRGPDAAPLRTPTKDDEIRYAKRNRASMFIFAYFTLFSLLAMVVAIFVIATSRLS